MSSHNNGLAVIASFIRGWEDARSSFKLRAEAIEKTCEGALMSRAIPCILKSRAKSKASLETKLKERNQTRKQGSYKSAEDIYEDIVDLGGVRIALYFPKQKDAVDEMIREKFDVERDPKSFSGGRHLKPNSQKNEYVWTFPGYTAAHYRVRLRKDDLKRGDWETSRTLEIQVVSVLGHAWAEVQHDSVYKELAGPASRDEKRIIDSLGGTIYLGECFLDQLCDSQKVRMTSAEQTFRNVYEMGFSISNWMMEAANKDEEDLGPLSALKRLLEVLGMNQFRDLRLQVQQLYEGADGDRLYRETRLRYKPFRLTPSVYIIDHILSTETERVQDCALKQVAECPDEHLHRLKVLASAMIWLDELFSPFSYWYEKLESHRTTTQRIDCVLVLDSINITLALRDGHVLDEDDRTKVDELWTWFDTHPECVIKFVFGISKLGILKSFPDETHLLKKVFFLLYTVLDPREALSLPETD